MPRIYRPKTDMVALANSILEGRTAWADAISASYNEAMRPEEGATRVMQETKTVKVKCVYPDPDDGVSYSWIKVDDEKITDKLKEYEDSYGGSK